MMLVNDDDHYPFNQIKSFHGENIPLEHSLPYYEPTSKLAVHGVLNWSSLESLDHKEEVIRLYCDPSRDKQ